MEVSFTAPGGVASSPQDWPRLCTPVRIRPPRGAEQNKYQKTACMLHSKHAQKKAQNSDLDAMRWGMMSKIFWTALYFVLSLPWYSKQSHFATYLYSLLLLYTMCVCGGSYSLACTYIVLRQSCSDVGLHVKDNLV